MGLFDFLKPNKNPDTLKDAEKETSKQLCDILLQVQNRQEYGIEDNIKVLAFRFYQHAFLRTDIPFVNVMDFANPIKMINSMMIKPSPMAYIDFHKSIIESLEMIVADNRTKKTNIQKSAVDISTIQLLKMFAQTLPQFVK